MIEGCGVIFSAHVLLFVSSPYVKDTDYHFVFTLYWEVI